MRIPQCLATAISLTCALSLSSIDVIASGKAEQAKVAALIDQLGNTKFARREQAARQLQQIGVLALPALRQAAATSNDAEIARRAAVLIKAIIPRLQLRRFEGHTDGIITVALCPDSKQALSGPVCYTSRDSAARVWDVATGKELGRLHGHTGGVYSVAFLPDGKKALTGGADATIRLWDVATGKELKRLLGHRTTVYALAVAPDGKSFVSGGEDGTVRL